MLKDYFRIGSIQIYVAISTPCSWYRLFALITIQYDQWECPHLYILIWMQGICILLVVTWKVMDFKIAECLLPLPVLVLTGCFQTVVEHKDELN